MCINETEKKMQKRLYIAFLLLSSTCLFFFSSCNTENTDELAIDTSINYTVTSSLSNDDCDLTRIKKIKLYNYCCASGWENVPATITFYTKGSSYKKNSKYSDNFFEDIDFSDFYIDSWGHSVTWTSSDTGVWNGSSKVFTLAKTLDLSSFDRLVITYVLEADSTYVNGGGIQIAFVDKDGNESEMIYISK
jgi:hypothetical protein